MGMPTEKLSVKNLISIFNNDIVITPNAQMMIISKNTLLVKEFENIWDEIYNTRCNTMSGSEYLHQNKELKVKLVGILEKFYDLGVPFQNGFTDEYYNNFQDINDYILNYGE